MAETSHSTELAPPSLRLEMKLKNNVLWHAIFDQCHSVAEFCRAHPELAHDQSKIGDLLRFKISPLRQSGDYRDVCYRLQNATRISVEVLFDEELYRRVTTSEKVVEMEAFTALPGAVRREIRSLPAPVEDPRGTLVREGQLQEDVAKVLRTLSYREREIIKLRFGLGDGIRYTYEEIGHIFKVDKERIRQIEAKALRKLGNLSRRGFFAQYLRGEKALEGGAYSREEWGDFFGTKESAGSDQNRDLTVL